MDRDNGRGAALYAAYLQGDASALEALVQLYGDALTRFAYCIVRDDALAEDVTADTFAALIVKRKKFREDATFKTYLYTGARNKAIDYVRKNGKNRPLQGLENILASENKEDIFKRERNERLYACMQKLPAPYGAPRITRLHQPRFPHAIYNGSLGNHVPLPDSTAGPSGRSNRSGSGQPAARAAPPSPVPL